MASPATGDAPNGITTPTNPNASGQAAANTSTPPSSSAAPGATANNNATTPADGTAPANINPSAAHSASQQAAPHPVQPPTSISDSGLGKRPKDARLIHMVLAHQSVQAYQERVPLQLLDFAYRYTAGVLSDAVSISAETTATAPTTGKGGAQPAPAVQQEGSVSIGAVRSAIASRLNYQFNPTLPKEFLLELGTEKNRVGLPKPEREYGLRLPPERYCFTGAGWNLKEEWESDTEDEGDGDGDVDMSGQQGGGDGVNGGERMEGVLETGGQEGEDEDDQDEFEEVMGVGSGGGGGSGSGGDSQMMDA